MQEKTDSYKFPSSYKHVSHHELLDNIKLSDNDALILFMGMDDVRWGREEYFKLLKLVKETTYSLLIFADDLPKETIDTTIDGLVSLDNPSMPSYEHVKQIVRFLLDNNDRNIVASCGAGISRSGWVSFFLDVKNGHYDSIRRFKSPVDWDYDSRKTDIHNGYNANSAFTFYAYYNNIFTSDEKNRLKGLPIFSEYTPIIFD